MKFIIAEMLAVDVEIGTALLNRHVVAIFRIEKRIHFPHYDLLIFKKLSVRSPGETSLFALSEWTKEVVRQTDKDATKPKNARGPARRRRGEISYSGANTSCLYLFRKRGSM